MNSGDAANKLVLITGSAGGIGSDIALHLASIGYQIGVGYTAQQTRAEQIVERIHKNDGEALAVHIDYQSRATITKARETLRAHFGKPVSILINNGAKAQEKPFETISDDDWQTMLSINLQGPFIAAQELLPEMVAQKWGRIINITSVGGQWGGFNQVHYAASKAALINFTQSLAKIYSKDGIASTAVAIGLIKTEMTENELNTAEGQKKALSIPAQRLGEPRDVSETIAFLCSDRAEYLTGQTLSLNGGMYFN